MRRVPQPRSLGEHFFAHTAGQIQTVLGHWVAQKRALEDILRLLLAYGDPAD